MASDVNMTSQYTWTGRIRTLIPLVVHMANMSRKNLNLDHSSSVLTRVELTQTHIKCNSMPDHVRQYMSFYTHSCVGIANISTYYTLDICFTALSAVKGILDVVDGTLPPVRYLFQDTVKPANTDPESF